MTQRGRHRRRRKGRVLRALLGGTALALTAAATMISVSQASNTHNPGALKPLTSRSELDQLRLREQRTPARTLNRLSHAMGRPVGVDTVLRHADHSMRGAADCGPARTDVLPVTPATAHAWCWDEGDATTPAWQARSVTTSGDADDDGRWGGHRVVLSGWTRTAAWTAGRGQAKVAIVDVDDPSRPAYSWALLTVPVDGGRNYRGLVSQVSGLSWYRDKLYVTANGTGGNGKDGTVLYVYDVNRVQRATAHASAVGRTHRGWAAQGYRWVLPAVASYRLTGGTCGQADGADQTDRTDRTDRADRVDQPDRTDQAPCPGTISVDRSSTPDSLVVGERTPAGTDRPARLWRYPFSTDPHRAGLLATDADGVVRPTEAYETKAAGVRGVLSHRPGGAERTAWYVGVAPDATDGRGALWRQDVGGARAARCGGTTDPTHRCWGDAAQALSYAGGAVWSLTEPPTGERASGAGRMLFAVPLRAIDGSLD